MTTTAHNPLTTRRGVVHRWTRSLIPTSKQAPSDAEAPSHRLLVRGGFIRRVGSGIYDYLPLAWRTLSKIQEIVREEMNREGGCEMLMPALEPIELMRETGRDEAYGDNLFRITDRHGRVEALAPTHEEIITELMRNAVSSYKQLPLNLYQIQTKFRDEFRPRSGLLRCREFIMKDAYSFHLNAEGAGGLGEGYDAMYRAYVNVFQRCGLDFSVVEAESGPIGGSASHEFMVNCESGEDTILKCPESGYAANVEKCEIGERPHDLAGEPTGELERVHTPDLPGIDEVGKFMKVKPQNMLKTIVFDRGEDVHLRRWVIAIVRGDHEVNEGKVRDASGGECALADEALAKQAGFSIGFVAPDVIVDRDDCMMVIDPDAAQSGFWATGANEIDHHVKHFNWQREVGDVLDSGRVVVADIRNAQAGDPSPRAEGATLEAQKGIEVGHIFKLGTKYSEAMGFEILNEQQERVPVIMGCYGIGVSRTMAACVEMSHDEHGIIWPSAIAPYHVHVIAMESDPESDVMQAAESLCEELSSSGLDVLLDNRDERPGPKFKDADLIGMPIRVTVGAKALAEDCVEFKLRTETGKGELVSRVDAVERCLTASLEMMGV
ncbi:MAG: proline--tRNA ligase [Phycisphaerales bacterium JB043]